MNDLFEPTLYRLTTPGNADMLIECTDVLDKIGYNEHIGFLEQWLLRQEYTEAGASLGEIFEGLRNYSFDVISRQGVYLDNDTPFSLLIQFLTLYTTLLDYGDSDLLLNVLEQDIDGNEKLALLVEYALFTPSSVTLPHILKWDAVMEKSLFSELENRLSADDINVEEKERWRQRIHHAFPPSEDNIAKILLQEGYRLQTPWNTLFEKEQWRLALYAADSKTLAKHFLAMLVVSDKEENQFIETFQQCIEYVSQDINVSTRAYNYFLTLLNTKSH